MNLETVINKKIWAEVKRNYENSDYSSAITDAMFYLTELIRNKTGLSDDGTSLVNQAFGGTNPKIKITKCQTQTEKDTQKGILHILMGMYSAIRNPRTHDKIDDKQRDADAIIIFIDYLVSVIDEANLAFTVNDFMKRIYDEHYVPTKEYSDLLVSEIPLAKRLDVAIELIKNSRHIRGKTLMTFSSSFIASLDPDLLGEFDHIMSDSYKSAGNQALFDLFRIYPVENWDRLDNAVRIRVENIVKNDIKEGRCNEKGDIIGMGRLGAWLSGELKYLSSRDEIHDILIKKLSSSDRDFKQYALEWFWNDIVEINKEEVKPLFRYYIRKQLENNNIEIINLVKAELQYSTEDHPWWEDFKEELKHHPEIKIIDEELPF